MLLALGLTGCGDEPDMGVCLSIGPMPTTTATGTGTGATGTSGDSGDTEITPCLSPDIPAPTTGPMDSTGTGTGSDSGSGTEGSGTGGVAEAPADSRADAIERLLDRGALPPDVAARLREPRG